jgi:hypothetical protein
VYGHLVPDYLKAEVDRLRFGGAPPTPSAEPEPSATVAVANAATVAVANAEPFAACVL